MTFTKWPFLERTRYKSPVEPVLQTFAIPLSDFAQANPEFDPGMLKQIRLRFDRTQTAVILLDDVGWPPFPKTNEVFSAVRPRNIRIATFYAETRSFFVFLLPRLT